VFDIALAQMPGTNDADCKDLVAYNLTDTALTQVIQASKNIAEAVKEDARFEKQ
jgi:hypothetical protein